MDWGDIIWIARALFLFAINGIGTIIGLWQMRKADSRLGGTGALIASFLGYVVALNLLLMGLNVRLPALFTVVWCAFALILAGSNIIVAVLGTREWYANRAQAVQPTTQLPRQG